MEIETAELISLATVVNELIGDYLSDGHSSQPVPEHLLKNDRSLRAHICERVGYENIWIYMADLDEARHEHSREHRLDCAVCCPSVIGA